jgi:hypothetical protein
MSIEGLTLMKGATGITVVGGTSAEFTDDGLQVSNGIHVVDESETNALVRPHATFKNKPHALQGNGTYSKGVRTVNITVPKLLADGTISYTVFRGTIEIHPELSVAEITEIRRLAVQCLSDADLDNFYVYGSVK